MFPGEKFNERMFPLIEKSSQMINTIRLDRNNLRSIQNKLPKCNYEMPGKENDRSEENKIKNNYSCVSKIASRENLHEKLPLIRRSQSSNKREVMINRREVLIKLRS